MALAFTSGDWFAVWLSPEAQAAVDEYRRRYHVRSRQQALGALVRDGLAAAGIVPAEPDEDPDETPDADERS